MNPRFWALKALKIAFFVALFVTVAGFVTMSLWNWLVPVLFHGPVLTFAQALGLLVLSKLLLGFRGGGGGGRSRGGAPWMARKAVRAKMERRLASMTDEQRAEFRARMAKCGPRWAKWTGTDPEPATE